MKNLLKNLAFFITGLTFISIIIFSMMCSKNMYIDKRIEKKLIKYNLIEGKK